MELCARSETVVRTIPEINKSAAAAADVALLSWRSRASFFGCVGCRHSCCSASYNHCYIQTGMKGRRAGEGGRWMEA